jgi:hypothetical protein
MLHKGRYVTQKGRIGSVRAAFFIATAVRCFLGLSAQVDEGGFPKVLTAVKVPNLFHLT